MFIRLDLLRFRFAIYLLRYRSFWKLALVIMTHEELDMLKMEVVEKIRR